MERAWTSIIYIHSTYYLEKTKALLRARSKKNIECLKRRIYPNQENTILETPGNTYNNSQQRCYKCGSSQHLSNNKSCPAIGRKCRNCSKIGHFQNVCQSSEKDSRRRSIGFSQNISSRGSNSRRNKAAASSSNPVTYTITICYVHTTTTKKQTYGRTYECRRRSPSSQQQSEHGTF